MALAMVEPRVRILWQQIDAGMINAEISPIENHVPMVLKSASRHHVRMVLSGPTRTSETHFTLGM